MKQTRKKNALQMKNLEEEEENDCKSSNKVSGNTRSNEKGNIYLEYTKTKLSKKCVILESCGKGGFGSVEAYYDHTLGRVIAAKKFAQDKVYLQEKRRLTRLKQEQLQFVNDLIGFCDQENTLLFELGEATLLEVDDALRVKQQSWKDCELAYIGWSLLRGLSYLRKMQSYHSDISPNNAMFFMEKVKFIDLGSSEVNNNQAYLNQFKLEFVNHQIKAQCKRKKDFTDAQITQNEMFALGKTLLYLALKDQRDRSKFIMNVKNKTQSDLIQQQIDSLEELKKLESLKQAYPKVSKAIIALLYPFQISLEQEEGEIDLIEQTQKEQKNEEKKEEKFDSIQNSNKSKPSTRSPKNSSLSKSQTSKKNQEDEKIGKSNSKKGVNYPEVDDDQDDKRKRKSKKDLEPLLSKKRKQEETNLDVTLVTSTEMVQTLIPSHQLKSNQDMDQIKDGLNENSPQGDLSNENLMKLMDKIISLFESVIQKEISKVNKDSEQQIDVKLTENYGVVVENSDEIRLAVAFIQQKRIGELLSSHDDPSRELVFLSTSTAAEWRKEIAMQMIQDALNAFGNLRQQQQNNTNQSSLDGNISKNSVQKMIHEKILKIQQRILKRKQNIENQFVDAIKQLFVLCKENKEYHSLIECHIALYLILRFLGTNQEADQHLKSALKKLSYPQYANIYKNSLTLKKVEEMNQEEDICWETVEGKVNQQIEEIRNNSYTFIY